MKKAVILILFLVFLLGCSASRAKFVMKEGQTKEEFWKDRQQCEAEISYYTPWVGGFKYEIENSHYNRCMKAKGYSWQ